MTFLMLLLFGLWSTTLIANDLPPPFTAKYKLFVKGIPVGKGIRSLSALKNGKWAFKTIGETTGLVSLFKEIRIEERSEFMLVDGKVRPLEYSYHQTGKKSRDHHLQFDWANEIAISSYKDQTKKIPLKEGILDRLLYQLVLMQELKQGQRQLQYQIASKGKVTVYRPEFLGKERIVTGLGRLETLKYERVSSNKKRRTTLWCAPNLHYLPVRVEHVEKKDGDVFSLVLQSVEGLTIEGLN